MDALGHIFASDVNLSFPAPGFAQLWADEMGNAGDPSDGFDSDLAQTTSDLSTIETDLSLLDDILAIQLLLGDPTGPSDLSTRTPFMQAHISAANVDLASLNNLALAVGLQPFTNTLPNTQPTPGQTMTPNTAQACSGTNTIVQYNASALNPVVGVNINDPFDVGATFVGGTLETNGDPSFFNATFTINVHLDDTAPQEICILTGPPVGGLPPGVYYVQLNLNFNLDQGNGTGTLLLCVEITLT